ncbi:exodeoxyribonuclease V subunit beta [Thiolapillus sp.]
MNKQPLDIIGLPLQGCQLIEASAGTGKTFSITRIYLRLLLEKQLDVRNILVMTFTRAATEELRGRIAAELRHALENWGQFDAADDFYQNLSRRYAVEEARPLLHRALLFLDEAPVFTIHSFCRRVLDRHAFATGMDFDTSMEQELDDIQLQAVRDWYRCLAGNAEHYALIARHWPGPENFFTSFGKLLGRQGRLSAPDPEEMRSDWHSGKQACKEQLLQHQTELFTALVDKHQHGDERRLEWQALMDWLEQEDETPMPEQAAAFLDGRRWGRSKLKDAINAWLAPVKALKEQGSKLVDELQEALAYRLVAAGIDSIDESIQKAKRAQRVMGFDDLVERLAEALEGGSGQELAEVLSREYPAALVDEFQDTDPLQYRILQRIYTPERRRETALYLIGDPKQAIYAFRGGDVFAYLSARADADVQWRMDTNWRSSTAMVQAGNRLFHGAPLDQPEAGVFGLGIEYTAVKASGKGDETPLQDPEKSAALQLVHFPAHADHADSKERNKAGFRAVIASWCAAEIGRLLGGEVLLGDKPVQARDIVILVRDRTEAEDMRQALEAAGLPSVYLSLRDKLFASQQAAEFHQALLGILEPEDERLARAALASVYLGGDARTLQRMNEDEDFWESQHERLQQLRRLWRQQGFVAMALSLFHQFYRPPEQDRERALTNSLHLMELLQQASQRHASPRQLLNWLAEQIRDEGENIEAELRLETDADLLRIQTQHGAKGLEYPVVFIPFATRYKDPVKFGNRRVEVLGYHNRETFEPVTWLGKDADIANLAREEGHAESVRLLYVAVTRAAARCYVCSTPFRDFEHSPLGQILGLPHGDDLKQSLQSLASEEKDIALSEVIGDSFPVADSTQTVGDEEPLSTAVFSGRIRRDWWLSSFSALTRNLRHGGISLPDRDQAEERRHEAAGQLRFALPAGAAAGNLLHEIFEHLDFAKPDWRRVLRRPLAGFGPLPEGFDTDDMVGWLQAVLDAPLAPGLSLSRLQREQTLRETAFYFPMVEGNVRELERVLALHREQETAIELPVKRRLRGMMHGFIDLIFEWQGSYYVADYKSNFLGARLQDYDKPMMENSMRQSFYDLQYLLYSLALHRYLQASLDDYQPDRHFGGVYYFFLRGMSADADTGVYHRTLPEQLLTQLDALFGRHEHV